MYNHNIPSADSTTILVTTQGDDKPFLLFKKNSPKIDNGYPTQCPALPLPFPPSLMIHSKQQWYFNNDNNNNNRARKESLNVSNVQREREDKRIHGKTKTK